MMVGSEDWNEQIALVAGGRGGIGSAVVEALLASGARVAVADAAPDRSDRDIHADLYASTTIDVRDTAAVEGWVGQITDLWGTPTILVVASGVSGRSRLIDTDDAEWEQVVGTTLTGPFVLARAVIRRMRSAGSGGRIVMIGSWAAHAPHPHIGGYSVAKAGLRMLVRTLALDHAQDAILVNEVAPGIVDTGLSAALFEADHALAERTSAAIPSGLIASAASVARDVLFLASPENTGTTGATLVSDGGLSLASTMNTGRHEATR